MIIQTHTAQYKDTENSLDLLYTFEYRSFNNWLYSKPFSVKLEILTSNTYFTAPIYRQSSFYKFARIAAQPILDSLPLAESNYVERTYEQAQVEAAQAFKEAVEYNLPVTTYTAYRLGASNETAARRCIIAAIKNNILTDIDHNHKYYKIAKMNQRT
jgi:hypothetical protein